VALVVLVVLVNVLGGKRPPAPSAAVAPSTTSAPSSSPSAPVEAHTTVATTAKRSPTTVTTRPLSTSTFHDPNGTPYSVGVLGLTEPAQASNFLESPGSGEFLVAVEFQVKDISTQYRVSDSAGVDATVVGSDDQTYTLSVDPVTGCTDFDNTQFNLEPGETDDGCVAFELPDGVKVTTVKWTDESGALSEWSFSP
jgi:hypothetical protein